MTPVQQMMERQRMLADFGEFALRNDDLQEVLTEACRLVVQALEADFAKVVEIQGVISTLVRMRADTTASREAAAELTAVGQRIDTLRLLHEQLYRAGTADRLLLRPYMSELIENLLDLYSDQSDPVRLDINIATVELGPDFAVPLGLILNEFATNSLKYAFDGKGGIIAVYVEDLEDERMRISFCDTGKGLPDRLPAAAPGLGTGMRLIDGLARQIGAEVEWSSSPRGTELCLEFIPR